jgi:hypothetical protein
VVYYEVGTSPVKYTTQIINDDGSVIHTFNEANGLNVWNVNNSWKAVVSKQGASPSQDVYSLPGQQLNIKSPAGGDDAELSMYPNPMHEAATLEYSLPSGTTSGQLQVYSTSGALVRSYNVTNQFSSIIIHRGDLPAGSYIYRLQATGIQPIAKPFIIQ